MRVSFTLLLLIALPLSAQKSDLLMFQEKMFDFGEVAETSGKVEHEFTFVNNAARPIKIVSVDASCGCTTTGYSKEEIKQGKSGFVKVSFDPRGRAGYFNKAISITTDYGTEAIVLQIKGQVATRDEKELITELTAKNGNLRLKHNSFSFSKVYINREPIEKEFAILNVGEKPIHFIGKALSADYISISVPEVIQPQEKAFIKIKYDARKRGQYGFYSDKIELQTDDALQPTKIFPLYATCEEYFALLSDADKLKAPILQLNETVISMGKIDADVDMQKEVTVKNVGKKDLIIRALQSNCTCVEVSTINKIIKPDGVATLQVAFKPKGRTGQQNKSITIYSTDPNNPVQRINVTGYIPE